MTGFSGMYTFILVAVAACMMAGGAAGWTTWENRVSSIPSKCRLPAKPGPCRALFPSYFFNENIGGCDCFVYGGCAGNANRFSTLEECASECRVSLAAQVTTESCRRYFGEATFGLQQDPPPSPPQAPQPPQHQIQHSPQALQHPPQALQHPPQALQHPPQALQHPPQALQHPPQATQHPPLATQHPPLATQHPPLATQHPPLATQHPPLATQHPPLATRHPPQATQHPPLATHQFSHVTAVVNRPVVLTAQPVSFFAQGY